MTSNHDLQIGDRVIVTHPSGATERGTVRSVQCNRPVIDFADGTNCDVAPYQITKEA
jgi:FKBP-type peptidyl-prolyl cis-trans isomerase 2